MAGPYAELRFERAGMSARVVRYCASSSPAGASSARMR